MSREELAHQSGIKQRKFGRFRVPKSRCNLGELCDLSAGGARLQTRRSLQRDIILHITAADMDVFVRAKIVWKKKIGFLRFEYGVQFVDPTPEALEAIRRIAMTVSS